MEDEDSGIFQSRSENVSFAESDLVKYGDIATSSPISRSSSSDSEAANTDIGDLGSLSDDGSLSSSEESNEELGIHPASDETTPQPQIERRRLCIGDSLPDDPSEGSSKGIHKLVPGLKIICRDGERDEHWEFDDGLGVKKEIVDQTMKQKHLHNSNPKKVLKLQLSSLTAEHTGSQLDRFHNSSENIGNDDDKNQARASGASSEVVDNTMADEVSRKQNTQTDIHIELRDSSESQCSEWRKLFWGYDNVNIVCQRMLDGVLAHDAVVPGNSFGFLDGEPEIQYTEKFGWKLQEDIQRFIWEEYDGELLVGQAVKVRLADYELDDSESLKYAIYVPVMRVPLQVGDTVNAYLAFRAALREVKCHNEQHPRESISTVLCPALCNGYGNMPAGRTACQMKSAYDIAAGKQSSIPKDLGSMATSHVEMTTKHGNRR